MNNNLQLIKQRILIFISIYLICILTSCNLFNKNNNNLTNNFNQTKSIIIDSSNIEYLSGIEKENITINNCDQLVFNTNSFFKSSSILFLDKIVIYSNDVNYDLQVRENSNLINGNIKKTNDITKYIYSFTNTNSSFIISSIDEITVDYIELFYKNDCNIVNSASSFSKNEKQMMLDDFNLEINFNENYNYLLEFNKNKSYMYHVYDINKSQYDKYISECSNIYGGYKKENNNVKFYSNNNTINMNFNNNTLVVEVKRNKNEIASITSFSKLNEYLLSNYNFYINTLENYDFKVDVSQYENEHYIKCYTNSNLTQLSFTNYLNSLYKNKTINYQYWYNKQNTYYYYFSCDTSYIEVEYTKDFFNLLKPVNKLNINVYLNNDENILDNLITNKDMGLPNCKDITYNVDLTKSKYIKKSTDQLSFIDSCPTIGNLNILVIPIEFNDVKASTRGFKIAKIKEAFNGEKSVSSYYNESSYGKLNINFDVLDKWYSPKNDSSYYTNGEGSTFKYHDSTLKNGEQIVINEILNQIHNEGIDLAKYDSDNNGFIDAIVCIDTLNATRYVSSSSSNMYWAFCYYNYYLNNKTNKLYKYNNVAMLTYLWMGYDFLKETENGYYNGDETNLYTYIHEFGHALGAIDYYDTTYDKNFEKCLDGLDIMDSILGDHNPYTKMNYGWIDNTKLLVSNNTTSLTLNSFTKSGDSLIIANDFDETLGIYQEYYLMMYYTNTDLNKKYGGYFSNNGILLYKINASLMYYPTYNKYDVFFNNDAISFTNPQNLIRLIKDDNENYLFTKNSSIQNEYANSFPYKFYILDMNDDKVSIVFSKNNK